MKKRILSFIPIIFLIGLQSIVFHRWLFKNAVFTYGDVGFYVESMQKGLVSNFLSAIVGNYGFGNFNIALSSNPFLLFSGIAAKLGLSSIMTEKLILFYPIVFGVSLSSYFFVKKVTDSKIGGLIGSFVYSFNTYFIITLTGQLYISLAYALAPFALFVFLHLSKKNTFKIQTLFVLTLCFIGFVDFRILYIVLWILIFYFLYRIIFLKYSKNMVLFLIFSFIISIVEIFLINVFWILPIFASQSLTSNEIFSRNLFGDPYFSLPMAITFFHAWWTGAKPTVFVVEPIPFYFWIIPICAFSALFFLKRNKNIIFFAFITLLGIFLTKQSDTPFPSFYFWLYTHLPGFNAFREASKFYLISAIGFSALTGIFVTEIMQLFRKTQRLRLISYLIPIIIASVFLWNARPILTGSIDTLFTPQDLPKEYLTFQNFLLSQKAFSRILNTPSIQRFVYSDNTHPAVSYADLPDGIKSLDPKLLSLEGIKYVLLPYDSMNDVFINYGTRQGFTTYIHSIWQSNSNGFYPLKNIGKLQIWQSSIQPLPHIAPVKDLVYITGAPQLKDIISLSTSPLVAYYIRSSDDSMKDSSLLSSATKIYAVGSCVRCDVYTQYYKNVTYPYVSILPDSPLYPIISYKEKKAMPSLFNIDSALEYDAFLSEKRMVEVQGIIYNNLQSHYLDSSLTVNNVLLDTLDNLLSQLHHGIGENNTYLYVQDHLLQERDIIEQIISTIHNQNLSGPLQKTITNIDKNLDILSHLAWVSKEHDARLVLNIPKTGEYTFYLKKDPQTQVEKVLINSKEINFLNGNSGYIFSGKTFLASGDYFTEVVSISSNLLTQDALTFNTAQNNLDNSISIRDLSDPQAFYHLSFDYDVISGKTPEVKIVDNASFYENSQQWRDTILDDILADTDDGKTHHYSRFIQPHYGTTKAELHFILQRLGEQESVIKITNLKLEKVAVPVIVAEMDTGKKLSIPDISYQEQTPNHYVVHVENASSPFFLSLSDTFNNGWEIYDNLHGKITSTENKNVYHGNVISEYQYDDTTYLMPFISAIRDKKINNAVHVSVNSFGNGWLINKSGSYMLDIIFKPESNYIVGLIISGSSLIVLIGVFLWSCFREK